MKPNTYEVLLRRGVNHLQDLIDALEDIRDNYDHVSAAEITVDVNLLRLEAESLTDGSIVYNVYLTTPTQN